ncbi:Hypothetical protein PP7435_CHR2-0688 [Komagataella phaffii CBS 7435]|uniref:CinA C-terminal domain-containing protein n=3 Tax=Komagataella TaxID=460517 RepID=C4R161_KOMPG|nr:Hypothetical protein PAS_chr2-1_0598 [Komagataella phaffii GS115]ANZ75461.1 BA75_02566T0 [Komagataella pastoris]AOA62034.1 GQ67_00654T0 [Komagataella phaffii]CAH2448239.1 Hypothetical protein BQ9382_C2-3735 [Komagataella phaffii CBS 7435]AOA68136.1 GQ68_00734T0 [Komagataella phaffii GS115]CAY69235.1 Hypothetical protein PAS_chr2-1_0598 [Komagataella phaffii GS115]
MHFPPESVKPLVKEIAQHLIENNETVAVSEGVCGGLLSAYLVSIPGASQFFLGGTLVYSLKSRLKLSGWDEKDISSYTGPSEEVVLRLARNLKMELGATYVLSETGFAGPSGQYGKGSDQDEEVGTVYLGISTPQGDLACVKRTGIKSRSDNMALFAEEGLKFLLEHLKSTK